MRLQEPYRTTLLMRFHEDKTPREIARELGIPASSVRTHLNRGLQKLKLEISQSWGKDWKSCAPALIVFAGTSAVGAAKSGLLIAAAALFIILTATLSVLQPWDKAPSVSQVDVNLPLENNALTPELERGSGENAPSLELNRETIVTRLPAVAANPTKQLQIRGRCIDAQSGQPIADCKLELFGQHIEKKGTNSYRKKVLLEEITTDADGLFHFTLDNPIEENLHRIRIQKPGFLSRIGEWRPENNPIQNHDFGDLLLQAGTIVKGRVLSEKGQAVSKARITFGSLQGQNLFHPYSQIGVGCRTDENGYFQLTSALPPGPRDCEIFAKGFLGRAPSIETIQGDVGTQTLEFRLQSAPYVEGTIAFPDGTPVENAEITAHYLGQRNGMQRTPSGRSDDAGHFRIYDTRGTDESFHISADGNRMQPWKSEDVFTWVSKDIRIVATPTLELDILVVDAETGEPIDEFSVKSQLLRTDGSGGSADNLRFEGPFVKGQAHLEGFAQGRHRIKILPFDEQRCASYSTTVELPQERAGAVEIHLELMEPLQVLVRLENGNPVADSQVLVTDFISNSPKQDPLDPAANRFIYGVGFKIPHILSQCTTDELGRALVYVPKSLKECGLVVNGNHSQLSATIADPLLQGSPIEMVVSSQCLVSGTLLLPESMAGRAGLYFEPIIKNHGRGWTVRNQKQIIPKEDGSYSTTLSPGLYAAHVTVPSRRSWDEFGDPSWVLLKPELGQFRVDKEETMQLDWNALSFATGSLSGKILVDGVPQPDVRFRLVSERYVDAKTITKQDGSFHINDLPPGEYRVNFRDPSGKQQWPWELESTEIVSVTSGREHTQDFEFHLRTLKLRPMHPETGASMPSCVWHLSGKRLQMQLVADEEGWLILAPAPNQAFRGVYWSEDKITYRLGPIEPDPSEVEDTREFPAEITPY